MFNLRPETAVPGFNVSAENDVPGFRVRNESLPTAFSIRPQTESPFYEANHSSGVDAPLFFGYGTSPLGVKGP